MTDGYKVKQFNITSVLPMAPKSNDIDLQNDIGSIQRYYLTNLLHHQYPSEILQKSDPRYTNKDSTEAITQEINGLLERKAFEFTPLHRLPEDANILGGRFILAIKQPGTPNERYKARFVVQGHKDREKNYIIHTSKTVRHKNIRIMMTITASKKGHKIWLQDVTQAYIQGYDLQREVYIKPTEHFQLKPNTYLKLLKPLYGLSESGDSCFQKYTTFLKEQLQLEPTDGDQSFLYKTEPENDDLQGTMAVYVDDTLASGNPAFLQLTDKISETFESKPREYPPLMFAGININEEGEGFFLEQTQYAKDINQLPKTTTFDEFRTMRHKLAWLTNTKPEILAGVNILSQTTKETFKEDNVKTINTLIKHVTKSAEKVLHFKPLDLDSIRIIVYSDGSFNGNPDGSSQVGYLIFLADKNNNTNLIDYASIKSQRVVRSVLGAETLGLADACDAAIMIQHDLKLMLKKTLKITVLTDSATLFNVLMRNGNTTEKKTNDRYKSSKRGL